MVGSLYDDPHDPHLLRFPRLSVSSLEYGLNLVTHFSQIQYGQGQVRKQQLELDVEQQTGSKDEKEYVKAVYCHPAYLTYMQSTS